MTQNQQIVPTKAPTRKTVAATGGSLFGAAVATVVLYALDPSGKMFPPEIRAAITTIVTALVTLAAAYYVPAASDEAVLVAGGKTLIGRAKIDRTQAA